jgi:hypothetical protein
MKASHSVDRAVSQKHDARFAVLSCGLECYERFGRSPVPSGTAVVLPGTRLGRGARPADNAQLSTGHRPSRFAGLSLEAHSVRLPVDDQDICP